ncbi:AAA family ATPase [Tumidithrix helvetica PCC 7403]|uniref:ATP-binding protein n=1 Tax=Tumidithrix helvetica TaxID=3457545 RepID=UPI003CB3138D
MSQDLLTEIYNVFDPFDPPPKEAYVDCGEVRGDWSVLTELGNKIIRGRTTTYQLYTGHRGVGKSTELLRLKRDLEARNYFVVYFGADSEDIDIQDTEYADILLACTKHLVQEIKLKDKNPLKGISDWLQKRAKNLSDLLLTELSFEGLTLEQQVSQFSKITATIKAKPDNRREIRDRINANASSLSVVLNEFIDAGKKFLVEKGYKDLVLIVDNLDRIAETQKAEGKPSNYDEIFIQRHEQMRDLHCHVIYTVPIAMVYSDRCTQLQNNFDETDVLPMVMLTDEEGKKSEAGLEKFREIIAKRIAQVELENDPEVGKKLANALETEVFVSDAVLERLCLMSGGHIRLLMKMIQKALDHTATLPISAKSVNRALEDAKEDYLNQIFDHQWELLRKVANKKQIPNIENDKEYPRLLGSRCVLEYRYRDADEKLKRWYDVHPLIKELEKFEQRL